MAGKNEVTLTFAGDTEKLEKAFSQVGEGAQAMSGKVGSASKAIDEHGNKLTALGEKADNSERNIIGIHDVIDGTATIMQGPGKQGLVAYIQGWADLAGGIAPLVLSLAETKFAVLGNTAAMAAQSVWTGVIKAGTLVWAAAQWVLNAAMDANPIGLVVLGIIALIAIIEVIAHNTKFFKDLWKETWEFLKGVGHWFSHDFVNFFKETWSKILDYGQAAFNWFKSLPAMLGRALSSVASFLLSPFRGAFNAIADAWNRTVGSLHWTVPGWVPGIGGASISAPRLPRFHSGGTVPGAPGTEMLAVLQAGERVTPAGQVSGGQGARLVVAGDGDSALATFLHSLVRQGILQFELA